MTRSTLFVPAVLATMMGLSAQAPAGLQPQYGPEDAPGLQRHVPLPKDSIEVFGEARELGGTFAAPRVVLPIHTAPEDQGLEYGIWAAGADYKVSFHDDPTFVPYLGKDYPQTQSLSWQLDRVTVGATVIADGTTEPVRRSLDTRYEYVRGDVTEAYDVLLDGLEQTFVLAQRPAAAGDLVVTMRTATDLRPAATFTDRHRSVDFVDRDGTVILTYGEAYVFDAAGNRSPITSTIDARGTIALTVPAAFVAQATYPLTVDPLTTPARINGGAPIRGTDVCRDDSSNRAGITYVRDVSATDADCWGWSAPDGLGTIGNFVFSDITTSWSTTQSAMCNIGPASRFVIAIQREFGSTTQIRAWNDSPSSTTLKTAVDFVTSGSFHHWRLDVGGIERFDQNGFSVAGDTALVVYQRDPSGGTAPIDSAASDIYGNVLTAVSTGAGLSVGTSIAIADSGTRDSESPSVTKVSGGEVNGLVDWLVAYQEYNNSITNDDWDALATRVFSDGTRVGNWFPTVAAGAHKIDVRIEGQRGRYMVTYGRVDQTTLTKIGGLRSDQIAFERFDFPLGGSIAKQPEQNSSGNLTRVFRTVDIGYDTDNDSIWCGVWAAPGGTGRIFVERVDYTGDRLELDTVSPVTGGDLTPGGIAFNDDANNFVLGFGRSDGNLYGAEMNHATETNAPVTSGTACGTASISWRLADSQGNTVSNSNADQQVGFEFARVRVTGANSTSRHFLFLSLGSGNVRVLPNSPCRLLLDPRTLFSPFPVLTGSSVEFEFPLPAVLQNGTTFYFQDWYLTRRRLENTERLVVELYK